MYRRRYDDYQYDDDTQGYNQRDKAVLRNVFMVAIATVVGFAVAFLDLGDIDGMLGEYGISLSRNCLTGEAGIRACQDNCDKGLQALNMALTRKKAKQLAQELGWKFDSFGDNGHGQYVGDLNALVKAGYMKKRLYCRAGSFTRNARDRYDYQAVITIGNFQRSGFYKDLKSKKSITINNPGRCVHCYKWHELNGDNRNFQPWTFDKKGRFYAQFVCPYRK